MWSKIDLQEFEGAMDKVQGAINDLVATLDRPGKIAAERETILHFVSELQIFQSHDSGEAGFVPFVQRVREKAR